MNKLVVGVDLGGTQIRAVLAEQSGHFLARQIDSTMAHEGTEAVLGRVQEAIARVAAQNEYAAIGIGAPGPTDPYEGVVLMAPNLPGWRNVKLRELLNSAFHVPVFIGNDANLAALAEYRYGAGRGCRNMIYLTVSTGIGSGIVVDDQLLLGRRGVAAEAGHMTIDAATETGDDPMVGTLEGLASGPNIALRAQAALQQGAKSMALDLAGGRIEAITSITLNEAARAGDAFAIKQFAVAGRYLGIGITNLLHIFNPDRIVIGGGVWLNCKPFLEGTMWETIRIRAESPEYWQELEILSAALGSDVGILGAVALAFDSLDRTAG
jgi:glucokinase